MATENERECGFRQVHGIYLMSGDWEYSYCDRHEEIPACPCCATQPKFTQGIYRVEYNKLFGKHENCMCRSNCPICYPKEDLDYYLDWVGNSFYTEESFKKEAREKGISRQAQWTTIPENFDLKNAYIICAMKSIGEEIKGTKLNPNAKTSKTDMIILGYKPQRIEYLINESEKDLLDWKDKPEDFDGTYYEWIVSIGVTPIVIPDDDPDHHKRVKKIKGLVPKPKQSKPQAEPESDLLIQPTEEIIEEAKQVVEASKEHRKKARLEKYVNRLKNQKTAKEIMDEEPDREINVDQETGEISETILIDEQEQTETQKWVTEQKENIAKFGDKALDENPDTLANLNKKAIEKTMDSIEKKYPDQKKKFSKAFDYLDKKLGEKTKTAPVIKDDEPEVNLFDGLSDENKEVVLNLGLDGSALNFANNDVVQANKWLLEYFEKRRKEKEAKKKAKIETINLDDSYEVFFGSQ